MKKFKNEEKQKQTPHTTETTSNLDDLKKLGGLLASNVITQEEFDTKKKELLNL